MKSLIRRPYAVAALMVIAVPTYQARTVVRYPSKQIALTVENFEHQSAQATAGTAATDPGWPREYTTPTGGRLQIYQPQIASWEGQTHLVAYVAVAYHAKGASAPALGTVKVEADTTVAVQARLVRFADFTITETNFGSLRRDQAREIVAEIDKAIPSVERVISLDRVLASLDRSRIRPTNVDGVKAEPPTIFVSTTPAVLLGFDGAPVWSPIANTDLRYAVNTNWDVFEHVATQTLFLRHGDVWLKSRAIAGPWTPADTLPAAFSALPADQNWVEAKASLPARRVGANQVPKVFASIAPAELILLNGAPNYLTVPGASPLLWVSNTDSDVFRLGSTGTVYYLVAGRWFSAPDFAGPWTFATPSLPAVFQRIPADHPRARALASVPGTTQALEAVLLAQVPQTARVQRTTPAPEVRYVGDPRFETIEKTTLARAVNTDRDVIRVGDLYYMCFQGVWFVSTRPDGPWQIASDVPKAIYTIPASSPSYHVTYVTVVDTSPDWVIFATRAGYTGTMIAWGCAVWGTGWYHAPYVSYVGVVPVYYPYAATYGVSAWFDPWAGVYIRGATAYGPYGGAGAAARYNAYTGTYARGAMAWGPYGARGAAQAHNPWTGTYAQTRQGSGVYGSWGAATVQRGDDWIHTARGTNAITGTTTRVTRTDEGAAVSRVGPNGGGFVAGGEEGIYAGRDGNVYRRAEGGGGWQKYENGAWGDTVQAGPIESAARERASGAGAGERTAAPPREPPDRATLGQLDRDRSARIEGTARERARARPEGAPRRSGGRRR